jgi:hypothetical protein
VITGRLQDLLLPVLHADGLVTVVSAILGLVLALALPVVQAVGATRLMARRGRWLLVVSGLPMTVIVVRALVEVIATGGHTRAGLLLVFLGPALAPLLALLPSVGRWLAGRAS